MIIREEVQASTVKDEWRALWQNLPLPYPFLSYDWQRIWWEVFGHLEGQELLLRFKDENQTIGLAPFVLQGNELQWAGGTEISDYLDLVASEEKKKLIWVSLLEFFRERQIEKIELHNIPEDSATLISLREIGQKYDYEVLAEQEDVVPFVALPESFDTYLQGLSRKQRHELRRKLRRFAKATDGSYEIKKSSAKTLDNDLKQFFKLFCLRRAEKQQFMTAKMKEFFRKEARAMQSLNILDLATLCSNNTCVAMTIGFVVRDRYYLYNSAFDPQFEASSGGLILKVLLIKESIEKKYKIFDFMQGSERYKYDLGAKDAYVYKLTLKKKTRVR